MSGNKQSSGNPEPPSGNPFEGFNSFNTKDNPTLEQAKNTLEKLAQLIIDNNGNLGEPMIVGLQGKPGLGKSHLIGAFEIAISNTEKAHRPDKKYGISQIKDYKNHNIIISDDLFQEADSLETIFQKKDFLKGFSTAKGLPEFIFDLYDGKKIWIVSSNFDIKEILAEVAKMDGQDRLSSRINHLLATTGTLHLEGEDHRTVLATTGTRFSKIFANK